MKQYKYSIDVDISSLMSDQTWRHSTEEKGIDYLAFDANIVPGSFVRVFNEDVHEKKAVYVFDVMYDRMIDLYPMDLLMGLVVARIPAVDVFDGESVWSGRDAIVLFMPAPVAYKRTQLNYRFERRQQNDIAYPFPHKLIVVAEHRDAPIVEAIS